MFSPFILDYYIYPIGINRDFAVEKLQTAQLKNEFIETKQ